MYQKALVAIDGSQPSLKAVKTAGELFRLGAIKELALIYVVNFPSTRIMPDGLSMDFTPAQYHNELIQTAEIITEKARDLLGKDINARIIIDSGPPPEVILNVAEKNHYDLIIIGNRGLNQLQKLFLGSVSSRVVSLADCTVMIVK